MEENKEKKKKKKIIDLIIEIILIIIIILLLLHSCGLQRKADELKNKKIPTGNVDIIEIKCDNSGKCKKEPKNDDNAVPTIAPVNPTDDEKEEEKYDDLEGFAVLDDEKDEIHWDGSKNLKIFSNPAYEFQEKIAPESSNTYKFVVRNKSQYKLKYKITFIETNPYNINLKYKLKKNDSYVVDNYVSYNKIDITDQIFNAGEEDTYYLDWKWISSSNDTEIGKIQANYKLKIKVEAVSIYE
ncbi:MAG: hypothetical protein IJ097_02270 [Bacilli bacterium]|nr:hypothetical protein [Bacilli bacterium]